jgi:hypothetical protein
MEYSPPKLKAKSFTCPYCQTISQQNWVYFLWEGRTVTHEHTKFSRAQCVHCMEHTIWVGETMYYPDKGISIPPNEMMPASVLKIYLEAGSIYNKSPRGAAALLRLGIQILCKELGEKGNNINDDIGNLVKKGLPPIVKESLDSVRVIGNEAVHPGQIDTEDPATVFGLFELINIIVEYMIALPAKVTGLYGKLPQGKIDAIKKRDV